MQEFSFTYNNIPHITRFFSKLFKLSNIDTMQVLTFSEQIHGRSANNPRYTCQFRPAPVGRVPVIPTACIDPEERRLLLQQGNSAWPHRVYQLWTSTQRRGRRRSRPRLVGHYRSCELATHDAVCWLNRKHEEAGIHMDSFWLAPEIAHATQGRCIELTTDDGVVERVGIRWSVCTLEYVVH